MIFLVLIFYILLMVWIVNSVINLGVFFKYWVLIIEIWLLVVKLGNKYLILLYYLEEEYFD